jgi:hypothetical protein
MSRAFALAVLLSWEGSDNKISEKGKGNSRSHLYGKLLVPTWRIHEYANRIGKENYIRNERETQDLAISIIRSKTRNKDR